MANRAVCDCGRCRTRGLLGPIVLITIGGLFLIDEFLPRWDFGDLWPVLLIVIGIMKLLEYSASPAGHQG